ncbi:MAG: TIGR03013 family PEP-CTERM/XrtA system glycosyltransferase [Candidatus Schekmanbacteria bacterium]|nr:TIGR03013 family PEP-CTERM/XrtA system glycosyltransferase [Candidatus Schekmanbacteria bacterium]
MDHLKNSLSLRKILLFQIDSLLILGSCYLVLAVKFNGQIPINWLTFFEEAVFVTIFCQLVFFISDLYDVEGRLTLGEMIWRIVLAFTICLLLLSVVYLIFPNLELSKGLFLYFILTSLVLVCFWRVLFGWVIVNVCPRKDLLIIGTGNLARLIAQVIINRPYSQYHLKGFINSNPQNPENSILGLTVWGIDEDYIKGIANQKVNTLIVAISQRRENFPLEFLLNCKLKGIDILDCPNFYERITGKILIQDLRPSWLIFSSGFKQRRFYHLTKQILDTICAVIALVISSPLMLLVAVLVKLDSPGPVLFKQERAGENGKSFTLIKFRSMAHNAEEETGPVWAMDNDSRVTGVGKIIRKLRLDELPQIINVLRGEMSFVGPRPERPFFIEKLQKLIPYYNQRLMVKPGITGWAAVKYQYSSSVESALEKLQYDLYYIKNRSLILDAQIVLQTFHVIISGKGSR